MARPAAVFRLNAVDIDTLQDWLNKGTLPQNIAVRSKILLLLNSGMTPKQVSEQLEVSAPIVFK